MSDDVPAYEGSLLTRLEAIEERLFHVEEAVALLIPDEITGHLSPEPIASEDRAAEMQSFYRDKKSKKGQR